MRLCNLSDALILQQVGQYVLTVQVCCSAGILRVRVQQFNDLDDLAYITFLAVDQALHNGPQGLVTVSAHKFVDTFLAQQVNGDLKDAQAAFKET